MTAPVLRPYQARAVNEALLAKRRGVRRILLVAPTGAGKTEIYLEITRRAVVAGLRVGIFAHRRELITQPAARLKARGLPFGVVMAGVRPMPSAQVQLLSVQTVTAREHAPDLDVLIFDEAHHATAETYATIAAAYPRAVLFGLTATPERGDGAAMGDAFDEMIVVASVAELQAQGHLVRAEHIGPTAGKKRSASEGMADCPIAMYRRICEQQRRFTGGGALPAIFFGANVKHAYDLAERLTAGGYRAACIEGETRDRAALLERYTVGDLDVLTNVYVLTEGTDLPRTQVVAVARGCSVWSAWVQMGGRALRLHPGKSRAFILDPFGHTYEHGLLSDTPTFSLHGRAASITQPVAAIHSCKTCGCAFRPPAIICPRCGAAVPPPAPPKAVAKPAATGAITAATVVDHRARYERFLYLVYIAVLNGNKVGSAGYAFAREFNVQWPPYRQETWREAERLAKERIRAGDQKAG